MFSSSGLSCNQKGYGSLIGNSLQLPIKGGISQVLQTGVEEVSVPSESRWKLEEAPVTCLCLQLTCCNAGGVCWGICPILGHVPVCHPLIKTPRVTWCCCDCHRHTAQRLGRVDTSVHRLSSVHSVHSSWGGGGEREHITWVGFWLAVCSDVGTATLWDAIPDISINWWMKMRGVQDFEYRNEIATSEPAEECSYQESKDSSWRCLTCFISTAHTCRSPVWPDQSQNIFIDKGSKYTGGCCHQSKYSAKSPHA